MLKKSSLLLIKEIWTEEDEPFIISDCENVIKGLKERIDELNISNNSDILAIINVALNQIKDMFKGKMDNSKYSDYYRTFSFILKNELMDI